MKSLVAAVALSFFSSFVVFAQPIVEPAVREAAASGQSSIPVLILLKDQPQKEIMLRLEGGSVLRNRLLEARLREAMERGDRRVVVDLQSFYASETLRLRGAAFRDAELAIASQQTAITSRLTGFGAQVIRRFTGVNLISAWISPAALADLENDSTISEIGLQRVQRVDLNTSAPSIGAATFWNLGFTGGSEAVGVVDTGVRASHPAFRGVRVTPLVYIENGKQDRCFGDDASSAVDRQSHGTHVSGIVAGQGVTGFPNNFGVARGLGELIVVKAGFLTKPVAGACDAGQGSFYTADWLTAVEYIARETSARVVNLSLGGATDADDDLGVRVLDYFADIYGITPVVAAGNSGPRGFTVGSPGIAYNAITVANVDTRGTISKTDDIIAPSSSRGPTVALRSKPDIAAPGSNIMSANLNTDGLIGLTGTSMASPHVAGAAALLRDSGIKDPLSLKALLINSSDPVSTWQATVGWGFINLTAAQAQRNNIVRDGLTAGSHRFYAGSANSVRATLVWNRRFSNNPLDRPRDTAPLNNLDLVLYNRRDNSAVSRSASRLHNVEVVITPAPGDYVLKVESVEAQYPGGQGDEPFALAITAPEFTEVAPPAPELRCTAPGTVGPGASFTLSCTATNRGGLTLFRLSATPSLPGGFSGATSQTFNSLAPGQSQTLTWNLRANNAGSGDISVTAQGSAFDELYPATSNSVNVRVGNAPGISLSLSQTSLSFAQQTGAPLTAAQTVQITAAGGSAPFTVAASTSNGGNWLTAVVSGPSAPATLTIRPASLAASLPSGNYSGTVVVTAPAASNSPLVIAVRLDVAPQASTTVTIENPRIATSVELVNGCPAPASVTQLNATDTQAFFWFIARGARSGDTPVLEWLRPDGSVYERISLWSPTSNGNFCFAPSLAIAQIPVAQRSGSWRARLLWNNQQAASVTFSILVPPTVVSAVLAGTKDDPGSCDLTPRANYRTTDEVVKACFMVELARRGDTFGIRYTRPDGTRHGQFISSPLAEDTAFYYTWSWYAIQGFPVAGYTGEWKVEFLWNGNAIRTLTFVLNPPVSVEGVRMTRKDPETLGCQDPGENPYFLPRDPTATLWFNVSGALAGDTVVADFVRPDGSVFDSVEWDPLDEPGNWCFWTWINVKGETPGRTFGAWTVRVRWNGASVIDQNFRILPVDLTGLMVTRATVANSLCTTPVPNSEFLTTDSVARLWFTIDLANTGDLASIEWVDPRGTVAVRTQFQPLSDGGAWCLASSLPIAGQNRPTGNWVARALWNGVEVGRAGLVISAPRPGDSPGAALADVPVSAAKTTEDNQGEQELRPGGGGDSEPAVSSGILGTRELRSSNAARKAGSQRVTGDATTARGVRFREQGPTSREASGQGSGRRP